MPKLRDASRRGGSAASVALTSEPLSSWRSSS